MIPALQTEFRQPEKIFVLRLIICLQEKKFLLSRNQALVVILSGKPLCKNSNPPAIFPLTSSILLYIRFPLWKTRKYPSGSLVLAVLDKDFMMCLTNRRVWKQALKKFAIG